MSCWKYQLPFEHGSQATFGLDSAWMGDPLELVVLLARIRISMLLRGNWTVSNASSTNGCIAQVSVEVKLLKVLQQTLEETKKY